MKQSITFDEMICETVLPLRKATPVTPVITATKINEKEETSTLMELRLPIMSTSKNRATARIRSG